jgi:hypothetical protein
MRTFMQKIYKGPLDPFALRALSRLVDGPDSTLSPEEQKSVFAGIKRLLRGRSGPETYRWPTEHELSEASRRAISQGAGEVSVDRYQGYSADALESSWISGSGQKFYLIHSA